MSLILSSDKIQKGKKGNIRTTAFVQPLQFIPRSEKDEFWTWDNADFQEYMGLRQTSI